MVVVAPLLIAADPVGWMLLGALFVLWGVMLASETQWFGNTTAMAGDEFCWLGEWPRHLFMRRDARSRCGHCRLLAWASRE